VSPRGGRLGPAGAGDDKGLFPIVRSLDDLRDPAHFEVVPIQVFADVGAWQVTERATGRRFILKRTPPGEPDAFHEVIVSDLLSAVTPPGRPRGPRARLAIPGRDDLVLVQHVGQLPHVGRLLGSANQVLGRFERWIDVEVDHLVADLDDPSEPARILLDDVITDQSDRHEGNWLIVTPVSNPAARQLIPIDHALAFAELGETALSDPIHGRAELLDLHLRAVERRRLQPEQITRGYDELLTRWAHALDGLRLDEVPPATASQVRRTVSTRIRQLRARERDNLELLTDPAFRARLRRDRDTRQRLLELFQSTADRLSPPSQPGSPERSGGSPRGGARHEERRRPSGPPARAPRQRTSPGIRRSGPGDDWELER
jgi:hypothetical protein